MSIEHDKKIRSIQTLRKTFTSYGLNVPTGVDDALAIADVKYEPDAAKRVYDELLTATPDEFAAKAAELAAATAADSVAVGSGFADKLSEIRARRVIGAVMQHEHDLFGSVTDAFNARAASFSEAVVRVPDLLGQGPWAFTTGQTEAMQRARAVAGELSDLWSAWRTLAKTLSYVDEGTPDQDSVFIDRVFALCHPGSFRQAQDIATYVSAGSSDAGKAYQPLTPFCWVVFAGVDLDLAHPGTAAARRRGIQHGDAG